jgi:hypothetical protein
VGLTAGPVSRPFTSGQRPPQGGDDFRKKYSPRFPL